MQRYILGRIVQAIVLVFVVSVVVFVMARLSGDPIEILMPDYLPDPPTPLC